MNRRIKLALLAMLGFSTACSTVRNTSADSKKSNQTSEAEAVQTQERPRIKVMYGVPNPPRVEEEKDYEIDPVVEQPADDEEVKQVDKKKK